MRYLDGGGDQIRWNSGSSNAWKEVGKIAVVTIGYSNRLDEAFCKRFDNNEMDWIRGMIKLDETSALAMHGRM